LIEKEIKIGPAIYI